MMLWTWLPDAFHHLVPNDNFHYQTPLKNARFDLFGNENASWQMWLQTEIGYYSPTGYSMQNTIQKFGFTNGVVNIYNSLPNCDVSANTTNMFNTWLDRPEFWHNQDIIYNFRV